MENYRKSSHCTYDIKYHLVWITKYRKPVITGQIALRTRELIRIVCQSNEVEILAGHVGSDHIHLLVSVPPHLSASKLVQYIKGNTSRKLQMEYKIFAIGPVNSCFRPPSLNEKRQEMITACSCRSHSCLRTDKQRVLFVLELHKIQ